MKYTQSEKTEIIGPRVHIENCSDIIKETQQAGCLEKSINFIKHTRETVSETVLIQPKRLRLACGRS